MTGSLTPYDFFYLWNSEQAMYFQDEVGRWQAKSIGKSGANTGLILNETILSDLSAFTIPKIIDVDTTTGFFYKPDDFEYHFTVRIGDRKAWQVRPDQIAYVTDSTIDPPSLAANKFYYTEYEDYYSVLPASVQHISLDYIAYPTEVVWGYSYDAEGRQVYNAGLSTQPKWKNSTIITITKRVLENLGISFKDADFQNAGRLAQQSGN